MFSLFQERCSRVVGDPNGQCAEQLSFTLTSQCKRSCPTCCNGNQDIIRSDVVVFHQLLGLSSFVFSALDRADHGFVTTRNEEQQALCQPAECRQQLCTILDRQTAGGPRTCIDEATAMPQAGFHRQCRPLDRRPGSAHGGDGRELSFNHRVQDICRIPNVDTGISWAYALRFHRDEQPSGCDLFEFAAAIHK